MRRATRRATEVHTPTPSILRIQALCRGWLARQEFRKQRDDMRFLAVKGEFSVERRRRWVNVPRPEEERALPESMPATRRGFRSWFRGNPSTQLETKVTSDFTPSGEGGRARKCLARLMASLRPAPPVRVCVRSQSLRRTPGHNVRVGRPNRSPSSTNIRRRPSTASAIALALHRHHQLDPPPVPSISNYTHTNQSAFNCTNPTSNCTNPTPNYTHTNQSTSNCTNPQSTSISSGDLILVPLPTVSDEQSPPHREPSDSKQSVTPKKMALFKSGFGSLLSKASPMRPPPPPVPSYTLTPNIRALDGCATVGRSRVVESMNGGFMTMGRKDPSSLPCIPRLASAPIVNMPRAPPVCLSVDNARTYSPSPPPLIVPLPIVAPSATPPSDSPTLVELPAVTLPLLVAPPAVTPPPPPPPPPPVVAMSDTDDDSGIAASVTRLATKPATNESAKPTMDEPATNESAESTNHLSPRLSLRLSVDGASLFSGPTALGLSAFVTPLAPSPEEEEEGEPAPNPTDSDDDPVRARLRSLRSRRLANQDTDTGRRFRATQSATRSNKNAGKPLAKMGNLQLDRLTKLNTRRNSTYMACRIERFTVVREGDRPPSPSSAMLMRARERKKMEDEDEDMSEGEEEHDVSDDECLFDNRPITPPSEFEVDVKRKSIELAEDSSRCSEESGTEKKKQCRRARVQWGSRSVLRTTWLKGHLEPVGSGSPKSILVNRCESVEAKTTSAVGSELCIVRVACIEYPAHVSSADESDDAEFVDAEEDQEEEEYVPRRSTRSSGRRKKVV
ncbi:hypothetical protein GGI19_002983 [Coemansia pectinata]|uniref:Uncharacterized protein n=1 Tax=Coemansia pectinata TaxID=1052879 RepID=A0A9W8GYU7_9FUNG|nr:hypothetical protein GGI19_002983 [Coemansia pectinata]